MSTPTMATTASSMPVRPAATLGGFLGILGRRWISLVVCAVIGVLVGVALFVALPARYTATAVVDITPAAGSSVDPKSISTATQENVVTSTSVTQQAAGLLGRNGDGNDLAANVSVSSPLSSLLLDISYRAASRSAAANGANAFANAYLSYSTGVARSAIDQTSALISAQISALNTQVDQLNTTSAHGANNSALISSLQSRINDLEIKLQANGQNVPYAGRVVGQASAADATTDSTRLLFPLAGLIAGLVVGIVFAVVRDRRDDSIRGVDDLTDAGGGPALAAVTAVPEGVGPAGVAVTPDDDYRRLAAKVRSQSNGRTGVLVVDTGASASPTTPATLASAFAKSGLVTVLAAIRPGIETGARALSVTPPAVGLAGPLVDRLVPVGTVSRLHMLDLGDEDELGAAMMSARSELAELRRLADIVVVDAVNLSYPSSVLTLTSLAPQAVLLARHRATTQAQVADASEELAQVGVQPIGSVLVVPNGASHRSAAPRRQRAGTPAGVGGAGAPPIAPPAGNALTLSLSRRELDADELAADRGEVVAPAERPTARPVNRRTTTGRPVRTTTRTRPRDDVPPGPGRPTEQEAQPSTAEGHPTETPEGPGAASAIRESPADVERS